MIFNQQSITESLDIYNHGVGAVRRSVLGEAYKKRERSILWRGLGDKKQEVEEVGTMAF